MSATAPATPATGAERRIAPRYQPAFGTVYRVAPPDDEDGTAVVWLVWNISETGMSLLVAEPPKPGTDVVGLLTTEGGVPGLKIGVRVVHVRPVQTGDYCCGAQFTRPLSAEEMRPFLTPPAWPSEKKKKA